MILYFICVRLESGCSTVGDVCANGAVCAELDNYDIGCLCDVNEDDEDSFIRGCDASKIVTFLLAVFVRFNFSKSKEKQLIFA